MQAETLKAIATMKRLNQSDLARAAGVTRQRVSQWYEEADADDVINARMSHVMRLASTLGVDVGMLTRKLPLLDDPPRLKRETTRLLWDRLYPNIVALFEAALSGEKDALARVVQVYGLYEGARLFGERAWRDFPRYKSLLKPARRTQLELLWQYRQNPTKA